MPGDDEKQRRHNEEWGGGGTKRHAKRTLAFRMCTHAPMSTRNSAMSSWPWAAAWCKGVAPLASVPLTSAPSRMRDATAPTLSPLQCLKRAWVKSGTPATLDRLKGAEGEGR